MNNLALHLRATFQQAFYYTFIINKPKQPIQNMSSANDSEQHKDNHINITQYFESNKDRILNLAEKNYENLVEALTKDSIDIAAASSYSSSNSTSSLPQSRVRQQVNIIDPSMGALMVAVKLNSASVILFICIYLYPTTLKSAKIVCECSHKLL